MDSPFTHRKGRLHCEEADLTEIAERAGTPVYVYSATGILERFRGYDDALAGVPHRICYAVKANGNLAVLRLLAQAGAGFDIVSGGELFRVLKAGGDVSRVLFAGVGKTRQEIEYALESGIGGLNCESEAEIGLVDALAGRLGLKPSVAVRVNPDVDPSTHPYISTGLREHKFGVDIEEVEGVYERACGYKNITLDGVACHIGSQLLDASPLLEAAEILLALIGRLRAKGITIRYLDLGGGVGVPYKAGDPRPDVVAYLQRVRELDRKSVV